MRIVVAPDAFKGSATASQAAAAVAVGWRSVRPGDEILELPLADGGEGTLDVMSSARPGAVRHAVPVTGPDGRQVDACWLELPDGTGVVELAVASGLPLMDAPNAGSATTAGVGELLEAALDHGAHRLVLALGGSASVDGGVGALTALGGRFLDARGRPLPPGGMALQELATIDCGGLRPPPEGGVRCLVDVDSPLLGAHGAARVFGPQKGASPDEVPQLDAGLARLAGCASLLPTVAVTVTPETPGAGAAGGTAYGLGALWGAALQSGAESVAELAGLDEAVGAADVVITGEGRFDATSLGGKVVGHVLASTPPGTRAAVVAGELAADPPDGVLGVELAALAGGATASMADPVRWLEVAGASVASHLSPRSDP